MISALTFSALCCPSFLLLFLLPGVEALPLDIRVHLGLGVSFLCLSMTF